MAKLSICNNNPTTTTTRRRARWATALGVVLILAVLLACSGGPDGSCRAPTPCGQTEGHNP